jgi:hypothetical protein
VNKLTFDYCLFVHRFNAWAGFYEHFQSKIVYKPAQGLTKCTKFNDLSFLPWIKQVKKSRVRKNVGSTLKNQM